MTNLAPRALAAALIAACALTACKKHDETPTPAATPAPSASEPVLSPATPPAATPAPAANAVSDLQLGTAVGADGRVGTPATSFTPKDTLYASVSTAAGATGTLGARWSFLGADGKAAPVEVDTQSKTLDGAAAAHHEFHVSKPDGWPVGRYRVEILHDGAVVQTREFDVR